MPGPVLLYTLQLTAISSAILIAVGYLKAVPGRLSGRVFALGACFVALYLVEGMTAAQAQLVIVSAIVLMFMFLLLNSIKIDYVSLGRGIHKVSALINENETEVSEALDSVNFNQQIRGGKLYRETGLTIARLAKLFNIPEYRLRQFIHKTLGFRNFNAMLHHYRVDDAQEMLADPKYGDVPILTIALTVGYRSITPFNIAFREINGVTPSEYRRQKLHN